MIDRILVIEWDNFNADGTIVFVICYSSSSCALLCVVFLVCAYSSPVHTSPIVQEPPEMLVKLALGVRIVQYKAIHQTLTCVY